jgi:hypothetical protein
VLAQNSVSSGSSIILPADTLAGRGSASGSGAQEIITLDPSISIFGTLLRVSGPDRIVYPTGLVATDTANFATALLAGGSVLFAPGTFKLTGIGTEIGKITLPGKYLGCGAATTFEIQTGTAATTDIIRFAPTSNMSGVEIGNYTTKPQVYATPTGRHGLNIDLSTATVYQDNLKVRRIFDGDYSGLTLNGYSIYVTHYTQTDGLFASTVEECTAVNGMYWQDMGDSMSFLRNHFWGWNGGLDVASVRTYANHCIFEGNNGWVHNKPCLRIRGNGLKILNNNMELQSVTDAAANKAALHIVEGDALGSLSSLNEVIGNNFLSMNSPATGYAKGALIENANHCVIKSNYFAGNGAGVGGDLTIAASCLLSELSTHNIYANGTMQSLGT